MSSSNSNPIHPGPSDSERYSAEENAWLREHYRGEFHFLRNHGLNIYKNEHREEGRAISRALMEHDRYYDSGMNGHGDQVANFYSQSSGSPSARHAGTGYPEQSSPDLRRPSQLEGDSQVSARYDYATHYDHHDGDGNYEDQSRSDPHGMVWRDDNGPQTQSPATAQPFIPHHDNEDHMHYRARDGEGDVEVHASNNHGGYDFNPYYESGGGGDNRHEISYDNDGGCDASFGVDYGYDGNDGDGDDDGDDDDDDDGDDDGDDGDDDGDDGDDDDDDDYC